MILSALKRLLIRGSKPTAKTLWETVWGTSWLIILLLSQGCSTEGTKAPDLLAGSLPTTPLLLAILPAAPPAYVNRMTFELASAYSLNIVAAWQMKSLNQRCVIFTPRGKRTLANLIRSISGDPRIDVVEPLNHFETLNRLKAQSKEPYRHLQHAADTLHLEAAHTLATGRDIKVAVVDTGADLQHPELVGRVGVARDFVRRGEGFTADRHGTAIAGLISASADNNFGILGVAPHAELMLLKACWPNPDNPAKALCDSYTLALALDFAISQDSQVINLSLGGPEDAILKKLLSAAHEKGIAVVAAAGSESDDLLFPASFEHVLAVAAAPHEPDPLSGARPHSAKLLSAPGQEILATAPSGTFDFFSGSSMAAAQVSGIVALMLEHRAELLPEDILRLLQETARERGDRRVVDACAVVSRALDRAIPCGPPES